MVRSSGEPGFRFPLQLYTDVPELPPRVPVCEDSVALGPLGLGYAFAFGKEVMLQTFGKDKYGRTLADVLLSDGTNVNHTLVKDGWCWWYRKYAPGDTVLEGLEKDARAGWKGLWADPQPVPPWEWRMRKR